MTTTILSEKDRLSSPSARFFTRAETAFAYVAFIYFTGLQGPITTYFLGLSFSMLLGSLLRYFVLFTSVGLLIFRWKLSLNVAKRVPLMWALFGWVVASYFWSEMPQITYLSIRGMLLPLVCFALYFSSRYSLKQQLRILSIFLFVTAFISLILIFTLPDFARHPSNQFGGAWRGLEGHKNNFSATMTFSLAVFASSALGRERDSEKVIPQPLAVAGTAFMQFMIIASNSMTGLILSITIFSFLLWLRGYRWKGLRSVFNVSTLLLTVSVLVTLLAVYWGPLWLSLGKDPTLTGRLNIWHGAIQYFLDKFWVGYGLDAFWNGNLPYGKAIGMMVTGQRRIAYTPPHAHNGYIDAALTAGFIGLALFLAMLFIAYKRAFRYAYILPYSHLLYPCSYLIFFTILNFSESSTINNPGFKFLIFLTIYFSLSIPERELSALEE